MTTLPSLDHVSNFVEHQFPDFYKEQGQDFIDFVKAYYEWLEDEGPSRDIFSSRDIDLTADKFVKHFSAKYLQGIPSSITADKRFAVKHILDLYRSKGSAAGMKLLFRLLYNEDITIYQPSSDILRASDGRWIQKSYMEVDGDLSIIKNFSQKYITGVRSGAEAFVDSFERINIQDRVVNVFYLTNITGTFQVDEKITYSGLSVTNAPTILGSPTSVSITSSSVEQLIGDVVAAAEESGKKGLKAVVSNTVSIASGYIDFQIIDGGSGYTSTPSISITKYNGAGAGSGATFANVALTNTSSYSYISTLIKYVPFSSSNTVSFNANSDVNGTSDFISISGNKFSNNDIVRYTVAAGNTALTNLSNNTLYFVVAANSTGLKLAATYGGSAIDLTKGVTESGHTLTGTFANAQSFNANTSVNGTADFITVTGNQFANGDQVRYLVDAGNTALTNLSNNTLYYVVGANSTGVKLSSTYNGSAIDLTSGVTETGHYLKGLWTTDLPLNATSYGSYLNNANSASVINTAVTTQTLTIGTISRLVGINPGAGYTTNVVVSVVDTTMSSFNLPDANGNILGKNSIIYGNLVSGNGVPSSVRVINSGFGYNTQNLPVTLYNSNNAFKTVIGTIGLSAIGTSEGYWDTTRGFLSMDKYIEDNYYYQEYSYELQLTKSIDKYLQILKDVMHPVGNEVFGKTNILVQDKDRTRILSANVTQS